MKKSLLTSLSVLAFVALFAAPALVSAQSVEEGDLTFTPYKPIDLRPYYIKYNLHANDAQDKPYMVATPNPSTDGVVRVSYERIQGQSHLEILDQSGKVVASQPVGSSRETQGVATLNVETLAAGLYFIRLTTGAYQMVQKVLIR